MVEAVEAVGGAGGGLDGPVGGFGAGVGDVGLQEAHDLGPPGLDGAGEPVELGQAGAGAPAVEAVQPVRDVVALPAGAGGRQQRPQLFPGDPGGKDLAGRVAVDQVVPHLGELLVRQAFVAAQQPPAGRPGRVGGPPRPGRR